MARLLLGAAATAVLCAWAHAAFSAAHLHWPMLTTALGGEAAGGCALALGKDVQEIESQGYEGGMAAVAPEFWFYDGARCSKWGAVEDARVLVASGDEMEWADGALRAVGREAAERFGARNVAWAEARAGEQASTVVCGGREMSRMVLVRTRGDGELKVGAQRVAVRAGTLYVFVEEGDGRVCAFEGWTEAPNKRLSVGSVSMDGGGGGGGVDAGRVAGGMVGVVALAALLYGGTWVASRAVRRKEDAAEAQGALQSKLEEGALAAADADGAGASASDSASASASASATNSSSSSSSSDSNSSSPNSSVHTHVRQ